MRSEMEILADWLSFSRKQLYVGMKCLSYKGNIGYITKIELDQYYNIDDQEANPIYTITWDHGGQSINAYFFMEEIKIFIES